MRRSAAPSQLHAAKRPKFIVPIKAGSSLVSSQPSSSELEPDKETTTVNKPDVITGMPAVEATPQPALHTKQKIHSTFLPPKLLSPTVEPALPTKTEHTSQQLNLKFANYPLCETDSFHTSREASNPDDKHTNCCVRGKPDDVRDTGTLLTLADVACVEDNEEQSIAEQTPHDCNGTGGVVRSTVKFHNISKKFQSPFRFQEADNYSSSVQNRGSSRGLDGKTGFGAEGAENHPDTLNAQPRIGRSAIANEEPENSTCQYFSVVWCKRSKKKHKKWEGDAPLHRINYSLQRIMILDASVLVAEGRCVTLYDMDGKVITKGSGYKSSELEALKDDETLPIGGKEIQVMSVLTEENFRTGKCFSGAGSIKEESSLPPANKSTLGHFKSFTNPVLSETRDSNQLSMSRVQAVSPRFDPSAPGALVMTRPTSAHQHQHNKQQATVVDVVVDPYLSYHLRPHQCIGVTFLYECVTGMRNYGGTGAILADDMGLGKTLQCIALIWTLLKQGMYGGKPLVKRVLIITPGSLVKNWSAEFRKWLGLERLQVFAVSGDSRIEDYMKTAVYPVLIISYEMFVRGYEVVKKVPFDLVVCDEGHRLKNSTIKTTCLINSLTTRRRIVLSGTPIQNDLQEFFAVVDFCNPGVLGSSAAFRRVYEEPILMSRQPDTKEEVVRLGEERAAEFSRLTRMFVLRRTQEVNNKYLPPKVELVLFCRPSRLQVSVYQHILQSKVVRSCLMGRGFGIGRGAGSPHLLAIAALKQVCNHPKLIAPKVLKTTQVMEENGADGITDGDSLFSGLWDKYQDELSTMAVEHSGKLAALAVILGNIFKSCPQEKVVLVSNHTKTLDMLQQFCTDCGYKYLRLDGHTPTAQRQQTVTRFNSSYGQEKVFLLSSKAGGVGLNLVGASRLFLYDIDWNPANDLQAMARVWRDGQKKEVNIYRLLTTGSLEEKVYQRQISKQGLSGAVMDLKASDIQFSQEDLKDLFSFTERTECDTHALLGCQCDAEGEETSVHSVPDAPSSQCQLTNAHVKQSTNLSMAELLQWQHLRGSSPHHQKTWCLEKTADYVSFLFWHKTNSDTHPSTVNI